MIELVVLEQIKKEIGLPVFMERPDRPPKSFVLIQKVGSAKTNHLESSVFAFQSYAETLYKAADLNQRLKKAISNLMELPKIAGIRLNGDYNFTDPEEGAYRYQAIFKINHY